MSVAVLGKCISCAAGHPMSLMRGRYFHSVYGADGYAQKGQFVCCANYDEELRHIAEPIGFYTFAWLPVKCRNSKRRWLTFVERHWDGSYTKGNRAF